MVGLLEDGGAEVLRCRGQCADSGMSHQVPRFKVQGSGQRGEEPEVVADSREAVSSDTTGLMHV